MKILKAYSYNDAVSLLYKRSKAQINIFFFNPLVPGVHLTQLAQRRCDNVVVDVVTTLWQGRK